MSDCFEKVNQAEGSPLSKDELAHLENAIDAHARYVMLRDGLSEQDARLKAGQEPALHCRADRRTTADTRAGHGLDL